MQVNIMAIIQCFIGAAILAWLTAAIGTVLRLLTLLVTIHESV